MLRCPITTQLLQPLNQTELARLNRAVAAGQVHDRLGIRVEVPFTQALVADQGEWIYRVVDRIPQLLSGEAVSRQQLTPQQTETSEGQNDVDL